MKWLKAAALELAHDQQLQEHGGSEGVRSKESLESALARPQNKFEYEQASVFVCAAAYAFGIARNHPFVDGNKRAAFLAMYAFLTLNGFEFECDEAEVFAVMTALAGGEVTEEKLAAWVERHSRPTESDQADDSEQARRAPDRSPR